MGFRAEKTADFYFLGSYIYYCSMKIKGSKSKGHLLKSGPAKQCWVPSPKKQLPRWAEKAPNQCHQDCILSWFLGSGLCISLAYTDLLWDQPRERTWHSFVGGKEEKTPTGMAEASNKKQKRRKHTHTQERRKERENGRVARGAHLHPLHFHSSSTSHPFCEHFVDQFCCFIHLLHAFWCQGGRRGQIVCRVMAKATNITL